MTETEELVAQYKELSGAMTQKERAEIEAKIWDARPPGMDHPLKGRPKAPQKHKKENYLHQLLGGKAVGEFIIRAQIHNAGRPADPLWERIEKDYSLYTAVEILREARKNTPDGLNGSLVKAIADAMKEYDSRPHKRHVGNGRITRSRSPTRLPNPREAVKEAIKPVTRRKMENPENTRAFWDELRKHVAGFIAPKLMGAPPIIADKLYKEFEVELKSLLEHFGTKLSRMSKEERTGVFTEIHRKRLIDACRRLSMDPPKPGKPVDGGLARTQWKRLVKLYHPDKHGGSEHTRIAYEDVNAAYAAIQQYNESFNQKEVEEQDANASSCE